MRLEEERGIRDQKQICQLMRRGRECVPFKTYGVTSICTWPLTGQQGGRLCDRVKE